MPPRLPNPLPQAGAVPYRWNNGRPEFCVITTARGTRWGFPKGIIDPGETAPETALKEAREEAGLRGDIEGDPLGQYEQAKWGTRLVVTLYLMRVEEAAAIWDEASARKRRWCEADDVRRLLDREPLRQLFETALSRLTNSA